MLRVMINDDGSDVEKVRVLENFRPEEDDNVLELNVKEGEILVLTGLQAPEGWTHARKTVKGDGPEEGLVPTDFVESANQADDSDKESDSSDGSKSSDEEDAAKQKADGDDDDDDNDDAGQRICVIPFEGEVGALNELTIKVGDELQLTDAVCPPGWVIAMNTATGDVGMVPEDSLGFPEKDGMSADQVELMKAQEKNRSLKEDLDELRREMYEKLHDLTQQKEDELEKVRQEKAQEEAAKQQAVDELKAFKTEQFMVLSNELKQVEEINVENDRMQWLEAQQRAARDAADAAYGGTRSVLGRRKALQDAEAERHKAELEFNRIDAERMRAEKKLRDCTQKVEAAIQELKEEEAAREANERTLMLLPGLRELMAPTQQQLQSCLESVTSAVMQNAEQSARLLAEMAGVGATPVPSADAARNGSPRNRASALWGRKKQDVAKPIEALLSGASRLGSAKADHTPDPGADSKKDSMPEKMRRKAQLASAAAALSPSAFGPKGVGRVGNADALFKGAFRSAVGTSAEPPADSRRNSSSGPTPLPSRAVTPLSGEAATMGGRGRGPARGAVGSRSKPLSGVAAAPRMPAEHLDGAAQTGGAADSEQPGGQGGEPLWQSVARGNSARGNGRGGARPSTAGPSNTGGRNLSVERKLQLGRQLAAMQASALADELRKAGRSVTDKSMPRTIQQIRSLVVPPDRRVNDRLQSSTDSHVRRKLEARKREEAKAASWHSATFKGVPSAGQQFTI